MISQTDASQLVSNYLETSEHPCRISQIETLEFGWLFCYDSVAFLDQGDESAMLTGNAPIIIDHNGRLLLTSTAEPLEDFVEAYRLGIHHQVSTLTITRFHALARTVQELKQANFLHVIPETDSYGTTWKIPRPYSEMELRDKLARLPAIFPGSITFCPKSAQWIQGLRAVGCCDFFLEPENFAN